MVDALGAGPGVACCDRTGRERRAESKGPSGARNGANVTDSVGLAAFAFYRYIDEVITQRRGAPGDDLVSTLVHGVAGGNELDHAHVVGNALLLLVGGNETTRNVIAGGLQAMLADPSQAASARRGLAEHGGDGLSAPIEECLRWVTPLVNMNRRTTTDVNVGDVTIPAGSDVLMTYLSTNRDEDVFDEPFRFDVERDPNPHQSFGFGPHLCLGAALARLELRAVYAEVLGRLVGLRLADPDERPMYSHSSFVRGIQSLPVVWDDVLPAPATPASD